MGTLEQKIKDFVKEQGIEVCGIAGPERLHGPPSLSPNYTMAGARSVISLVLPMDKQPIEDFLGKKSPVPRNLDENVGNQELMRVGNLLAGYLRGQGVHAKVAPTNADYRRRPDPIQMVPAFSHRLGALAAQTAGQGWSGNVKTEEYGAAVFLGTVLTDAKLESDSIRYTPRYFVDGVCKKCRRCAASCSAQMFSAQDEESFLLNNELYPRARRVSLVLCTTACFGLHALSPNKKWTTWGIHWINGWIKKPPGTLTKKEARRYLILTTGATGDSTPRFDILRRVATKPFPEDILDQYLEDHPEDKTPRKRLELLRDYAKGMGVMSPNTLKNDLIITCGNCALVCGPTLKETLRRHRLLTTSGLVAPSRDGGTVVVKTYEEAVEHRKKYLPRATIGQRARDAATLSYLYYRHYFGLEPKSEIQGFLYNRKLKRALKKIG